MQDVSQPAVQGAIRLIFEHDADGVRLVLQQAVNLAVTGFDVHPDVRPGHYVEIRDAAGTALTRVPVHTAFTGSTEVFPEDHGEPITRVDASGQPGAFTVVVPAPEAAAQIAVVRIAPAAPSAPKPGAEMRSPAPAEPEVTDLASFPIERAK
ncbi:MAG: hypothetical protein H7270_03840 [Dermatophilaceae bacterium]|nr:hypothetical protein [Dermatophilaceae bacterium]